MKVNIEHKSDKSQAELKFSIPVTDFTPFVKKAAQKLSADHPIKGFRPGKASVDVVIQHFGQDRLLREAMDAALPHFFVKAVMDNKIEAISRPAVTVEKLSLEEPFEFTATVDVLPSVKLGDVSKIKERRREVEIKDEQIDKELTYIAKMRSSYLDVARPAEKGDMVTMDFTIKINGEAIEGGLSQKHPVLLGEGRFIPEFEEKITGISAGDERQFTMTFPADYGKKDLQNKQADVSVKAHSVQKRVIPPIDDDFAKKLGSFTDLAHLKGELKKNMQLEMEEKEEQRFLGELAEKLAAISEFGHIPDSLVDKEIDNRLLEFAQMLSLQQKTLEDYLKRENKTLEAMRQEMRAAAEKNVKVGLAMRAFAKDHEIAVTEEEIKDEAVKHLQQYNSIEEAEKHVDADHLHEHVESVLKNRKTLAKLAQLVEKNDIK